MNVNNEMALKRLGMLYKNIKKGRSNKSAMLVQYYMDGCPACIAFKAEWTKAKQMSPYDHVQFVKLNSHFVDRAPIPSVEGFPTVRLITGSGIYTFEDERTAEKLLAFILKYSGIRSRTRSRRIRTRSRRTRTRSKRQTRTRH